MISWVFRLRIELVFGSVPVMPTASSSPQLHVLREAIAGLDLAVIGDDIAEARELHDLLDARICAAEAAYTVAGLAEVEGFANTATFERHRCRMTLPRSRQVARRAARVVAWPELGDAWREGRLTGAQVELAASLVPERHVERFAETIDDTIAILAPLTAHQTGRVLRHWVSAADDMAVREAVEAGIEPAEVVPERELSATRVGGELALRGFLDPDSAAPVEKALEAAARDDLPGERRTPKQRRADALVAMSQAYLDSLEGPDGNRRRERLTITADVVTLYRAWLRVAGVVTAEQLERFLISRPGLGELDRGLFLAAFDGTAPDATMLDGNPVTDSLLASVASGGAMELLLSSDGRLLHLGRTTRTFTAPQRRAVLARDGGCRGCGADPARCDIHHVMPWEEGGCTDSENAVALCRRCHRLVHRHRWKNEIEADGTYTVTVADGVTRVSRPPGLDPLLPRLPVATSSEPARPTTTAPPPTRRPRCDCPCPEHRSPTEEAEHQRHRHLVLERARRELGLVA
jgi:hypothetical protein